MYLGEGEARKQDENSSPHDESSVSVASTAIGLDPNRTGVDGLSVGGGSQGQGQKAGLQNQGQGHLLKGHEFYSLSFHMPQSCDGCSKPLWALVRPPPAMECR